MDRKTELLKRMQEELDRRTAVEREAIQFMCKGDYAKAKELLESINDSIIMGMDEELDRLEV